jgi:hypothetical protein
MHAEGRAIDWHLDVHDGGDKREAGRLLAMLFGPDSRGNESALARRMGILEAIWDCRYYGFWMGSESKRYGACNDSRGRLRSDVDPTIAHRNHIHLSLSRAGARMRTSYWRYIWLRKPLPKVDEKITRPPSTRVGDGTAGDSGEEQPPAQPSWPPSGSQEPGATYDQPADDAPEPEDDPGWDYVSGDDDYEDGY